MLSGKSQPKRRYQNYEGNYEGGLRSVAVNMTNNEGGLEV